MRRKKKLMAKNLQKQTRHKCGQTWIERDRHQWDSKEKNSLGLRGTLFSGCSCDMAPAAWLSRMMTNLSHFSIIRRNTSLAGQYDSVAG